MHTVGYADEQLADGGGVGVGSVGGGVGVGGTGVGVATQPFQSPLPFACASFCASANCCECATSGG